MDEPEGGEVPQQVRHSQRHPACKPSVHNLQLVAVTGYMDGGFPPLIACWCTLPKACPWHPDSTCKDTHLGDQSARSTARFSAYSCARSASLQEGWWWMTKDKWWLRRPG
jgi:hypothetical protein